MALLQALVRQANAPDFVTVEEIKTHIRTNRPHQFASITARLCVHAVDSFAKGTHIELIDAEAAENYEEVSTLLADLTERERLQVVFRLTVWSPIDTIHLVPGTTVRIQHIDHLTVWNDVSAQGAVHVRHLPPQLPQQPPNPQQPLGQAPQAPQLPQQPPNPQQPLGQAPQAPQLPQQPPGQAPQAADLGGQPIAPETTGTIGNPPVNPTTTPH